MLLHCDCAQVGADTERESALKVDSGREIHCRTGESNLRQRCAVSDALSTELYLQPVLYDLKSRLSCGMLTNLTLPYILRTIFRLVFLIVFGLYHFF